MGFTLSAEEHPPTELVRLATLSEDAGFTFATVSDHFHPWTTTQGNSPFVWSVFGRHRDHHRAAADRNDRHVSPDPTASGDRGPGCRHRDGHDARPLLLGVGTGENLNEHVTGARWPSASERREMLAEAIEIMRALWKGGSVDHEGRFYHVVGARLYSLPDEPPQVYIAASGPLATELAARLGDGLIATAPNREQVETFIARAGSSKPKLGQFTVCWASTEPEARRTALAWWPNAALKGELGQELPLPRHFEQATQDVTEGQIAEAVVCGPDPERHLRAVQDFEDAGFDLLAVHQVGPDPRGLRFYAEHVLPQLRPMRKAG